MPKEPAYRKRKRQDKHAERASIPRMQKRQPSYDILRSSLSKSSRKNFNPRATAPLTKAISPSDHLPQRSSPDGCLQCPSPNSRLHPVTRPPNNRLPQLTNFLPPIGHVRDLPALTPLNFAPPSTLNCIETLPLPKKQNVLIQERWAH